MTTGFPRRGAGGEIVEGYQEDDFGLGYFLKIYQELLDSVLWNDFKNDTNAQHQERFKANMDDLNENIRKGTPIESLDNYYAVKGVWASRLPPFLDTDYYQAPSGRIYNKDGSEVNPDVAQKATSKFYQQTPPDEINKYQQAQLENADRAFEYNRQKDERDWQYKMMQAGQGGQTVAPGKTESQIRQEYEQTFQNWKAETAAGLGQPQDWIKRWEVMHAPSPYAEPNRPWQDTMEAGEINNLRRYAEQMRSGLPDVYNKIQDVITNPELAVKKFGYLGSTSEEIMKNLQKQSTDINKFAQGAEDESGRLNQIYQANPDLWARPGPTPVKTGPNAPSWLPQFAPSQTAGKPITQSDVVTPSGQQWTLTPESVKAGLSGYAEWSGGKSLKDITDEMERMLPRNPRGAGNTNWSARRQ